MTPQAPPANGKKIATPSLVAVTRPLFPRVSLKQAIRIPKAIWDDNGGNPYPVLDLAPSIGRTARSSAMDNELAAAVRYGITDGGSRGSKKVALTDLGRNIVAPGVGIDVNSCLRQALLNPPLFKKFYEMFDGKPLPARNVLKNTLMNPMNGFSFTAEIADSFLDVVFQNIEDYGLSRDQKGTKYLRLDRLAGDTPTPTQVSATEEDTTAEEAPASLQLTVNDRATPAAPQVQAKRQIFVAHGKHRKPLEQLEKILKEYDLPYVVAVNEPHKGRPIGAKVAELMRQCSSGIFICTADEEVTDAQGGKAWRPSDNVVYELGAASVLFGDKIVIFREEGVSFGSDFSALGHITFEKDRLEAKGLDLLKELKGLGFLKFTLT